MNDKPAVITCSSSYINFFVKGILYVYNFDRLRHAVFPPRACCLVAMILSRRETVLFSLRQLDFSDQV